MRREEWLPDIGAAMSAYIKNERHDETMKRLFFLRPKKLGEFGYRRLIHAGFSWQATIAGEQFLTSIADWSPEVLGGQKGWRLFDRGTHALYLATGPDGKRYMVKVYPEPGHRAPLRLRKGNRARNEFYHTLLASKTGVRTVLPLAVGESGEKNRCGVIIYPFVENSVSLDRVYDPQGSSSLSLAERRYAERKVGEMLRTFADSGMYVVDVRADHFLVQRNGTGAPLVYWIDFERVRFTLRKKKEGIRTLGRLLSRMEWFRVSGGGMNLPAMMRIGCAYFRDIGPGARHKELRRTVVKAARKWWYRREFHKRGSYQLLSIEPVGREI